MKYWIIAVIGVLLLLVGAAMPTTNTVESSACTESGYVGDVYIEGDCVDSQTEVPNTTRSFMFGLGFLLTLVGGTLTLIQPSDTSTSSTSSSSPTHPPAGTTPPGNKQRSMANAPTSIPDDETVIKVSATTEKPTGEQSISRLWIPTTDIDEAKAQFRSHCDDENLRIVSQIHTEIVSNG